MLWCILILITQSVHRDGMYGEIGLYCSNISGCNIWKSHSVALFLTCKMSLDTAMAALGYEAPALQ